MDRREKTYGNVGAEHIMKATETLVPPDDASRLYESAARAPNGHIS